MNNNNTIKLGLERMKKILKCLNNPHLKIPIIHIGGTNGKGTICAYETEILKSSGYKVGRFTSPYLIEPIDSIQLTNNNQEENNQNLINKINFEKSKKKIKNLAKKNKILNLTSFEILTAITFDLFSNFFYKKNEIDLAIIEVGLGGLLDSTNVSLTNNTLFTCITPISIDHQSFLGNTIQEITLQKIGIAKPHVPVLIAQQSFPQVERIIRKELNKKSCDLFLTQSYQLPDSSNEKLAPLPITPLVDKSSSSIYNSSHSHLTIPNTLNLSASFQYQNAVTAATLAHLLRTHPHSLKLLPSLSERITNKSIMEGLEKTRWRGRMELIKYKSCQLLLDGAHNRASAKCLGDYIISINRPITLIISLSSPRDPNDFIEALDFNRLNHNLKVIITSFSTPELMQWVQPVSPELIADQFKLQIQNYSSIQINHNPIEALELAISISRGQDELIVVCGSLYLISDILRTINDHEKCVDNL